MEENKTVSLLELIKKENDCVNKLNHTEHCITAFQERGDRALVSNYRNKRMEEVKKLKKIRGEINIYLDSL